MRKLLLAGLLIFGAANAFCQNRIGFEMGEGWSYLKNGRYTPGHYKFATDPEITLGVNYLRRMNRNIYLGARLMFQQYAFSYTYDQSDTAMHIGGEIANKSSYFFFAPTLDIGIDNRQIAHVFISGAYGMLIHGTQNNHTYTYINGGQFNDYSFRTDGEISATVTRIDIGLVQHIPINNDWYVTLCESYSILQQQLTTLDYPPNQLYSLSPGYFNITAGLAYKFILTRWPARFDDED